MLDEADTIVGARHRGASVNLLIAMIRTGTFIRHKALRYMLTWVKAVSTGAWAAYPCNTIFSCVVINWHLPNNVCGIDTPRVVTKVRSLHHRISSILTRCSHNNLGRIPAVHWVPLKIVRFSHHFACQTERARVALFGERKITAPTVIALICFRAMTYPNVLNLASNALIEVIKLTF